MPAVLLSSTLRDPQSRALREAAFAGIRGAQYAALACDDWSATPHSTLEESKRAAREADVYVVVLGPRYGTPVSDTDFRSYTEVEFDEATATNIPRLAFIQSPYQVEESDSADETANEVRRRQQFKTKIEKSGITVASFTTAEQLRHAINVALLTLSLRHESKSRPTLEGSGSRDRFHAVHEYTLLDSDLAGRHTQLEALTKWAASPKPIMVLEAFGGFGKSALSWWWWELQRNESTWQKGLWFGFGDPSVTMQQFLAHLTACLTDQDLETTQRLPISQLEETSRELIRTNRYLIIMDGFERMLVTGNSLNVNEEVDEDNRGVSDALRRRKSTLARSLRSMQDPLLERWLTKLANGAESRILITTRYGPNNLEIAPGRPRRGVAKIELQGLNISEARQYWASMGLSPNDPGLERLVSGVHGHPLTLSVMAGNLRASVATSLSEFFERRPGFPLFAQDVKPDDGRFDVFADALANLSTDARELLQLVALFTMPAPLSDLAAMLCPPRIEGDQRDGWQPADQRAAFDHVLDQFTARPAFLFPTEEAFVSALLELEDRRLVSRSADHAYDLHPVIRSVVRTRTPDTDLNRSNDRLVDYCGRAGVPAKPQSVRDLLWPIQFVFSASRASLWKRACNTFVRVLESALVDLNEDRWMATITAQFFSPKKRRGRIEILWAYELPFVQLEWSPTSRRNAMFRYQAALENELMQKHAFSGDDAFLFLARMQISMVAARAYEGIGEYETAKALYEIHNRTCVEPLCQTMQKTCYAQAGRFGDAYALLRQGIARFAERPSWWMDPFELHRLASCLQVDCLDRGATAQARLALARGDKILRTWGTDALSPRESINASLRIRNLRVARLARDEGQADVAVSICREVVERASKDDDRADYVTALRELAESLRHCSAHEEADRIYDEIVSLDGDGAQYGNALIDRANRARNRIGLGQLERVEVDLDDVIRMSDLAADTRAAALLFKGDLYRAARKPELERKTLLTALACFTCFPGTPVDIWGVRVCLERLETLGEPTEPHRRNLVQLEPWSTEVLCGTDAAAVTPADGRFPLEALWSVERVSGP